VEQTQEVNHHPAPVHQHWLSQNRLLAANGAFAVYAIALALDTGHADRTWAIWAAVAYGVTTAILWLTRRRNIPVVLPLLVSLAGALAAPVTWLVTRVTPTPEVQVISRSAVLLLQHGSPYLPPGQLASWLSYNPYLPVMAVFGLPKALGASGLLADPRVWLTAVSIVLIWTAFAVAAPHRHCDSCRQSVLLSTVFIVASPVIAFPLAVGITDPPVIALMFLTLALIARPSNVLRAAAALGVACAMKATAWPAVPVFTAMLAARDTAKTALRFIGATIVVGLAVSAALAPSAPAGPLARNPRGDAVRRALSPADLILRRGQHIGELPVPECLHPGGRQQPPAARHGVAARWCAARRREQRLQPGWPGAARRHRRHGQLRAGGLEDWRTSRQRCAGCRPTSAGSAATGAM